ncbi:MAG TPA: hypothetical protein DER10_07985 [Elusimicrobia bacterium]|nr:hypothetical protein [Elusimicrobiota bacterium]HCE98415.1 hypothetical protein [Elusimicrobiota bacterium]
MLSPQNNRFKALPIRLSRSRTTPVARVRLRRTVSQSRTAPVARDRPVSHPSRKRK